MTPTDKPMTVDALTDLAQQLALAHFNPSLASTTLDEHRHSLRTAIEQYGREQYARGVNDVWPAGRGSGEPARRWPFVETPGQFAERMREALRDFGGDMLAACRYCLIESPPTIARHQSHEPLTDEQINQLWCACLSIDNHAFARDFARAIERAHNIRSKS